MLQLKGAPRSISIELADYLKEIKDIKTGYTKQAYSRARQKLKHEGYIKLNDVFQRAYYSGEHKRYKGYRLIAMDGSGIQMPYGEDTKEEFGSVNNDEELINLSWSTVVYDLLNDITIDAKLNKTGESERKYAIEQFKEMKENGRNMKDIVIADRGFPSLELLAEMGRIGNDYIIRYNGNQFLKETRLFTEMQEKDMIVEIPLRTGNKRKENERIKKLLEEGIPESIRVRIIKIELNTGEIEYLITSLLNSEEFGIEDFNKIYNMRWKEETHFNFLKNVLQIENFSGKSPESIRQDYYSRILVSNIHSIIVAEAQAEIEKEKGKNKKLKYDEYKVNKNVSYGIMRDRIYDMLGEKKDNWEGEYDELVTIAKKYKIATRKGRNFPRKRKGRLKYPMNMRRAV